MIAIYLKFNMKSKEIKNLLQEKDPVYAEALKDVKINYPHLDRQVRIFTRISSLNGAFILLLKRELTAMFPEGTSFVFRYEDTTLHDPLCIVEDVKSNNSEFPESIAEAERVITSFIQHGNWNHADIATEYQNVIDRGMQRRLRGYGF